MQNEIDNKELGAPATPEPATHERSRSTASPPVGECQAQEVEKWLRASIPSAIVEQVLAMGRAEWGATAELTDAGHLEHLRESLRLTREHFNFEDVPVPMHGLYLQGTETVLCHTGTSPNSPANAQALAGAWNWLHDICASGIEAGTDETLKAAQPEGREPGAGTADATPNPRTGDQSNG